MKQKDSKLSFEMYLKTSLSKLIEPTYQESAMQIVEVTDGLVVMQIGTEFIEAKTGDFLYIPAQMVCSARAIGGPASIRGLIFDKAIIEADMANYENEILYMFYIQSENKVTVFDNSHPIYSILCRCMNEAYEEYLLKDVCYKLPIRANIYLMMSALLRYYCGSKNELEKIVYHNVLRLRPVINYVGGALGEKIRIEQLADMIMVSADYFTKMFKDSIGKTPVDYINGLRINKAMQLLIDEDISMAQISEAVGFCNANYFHKIFKQYMNMSPLAFRKAVKQ